MRRFDGKELLIATHNQGKLEEIADLLSPYGVTLTSNVDHGLPEPEETETTFVGNARIKAHAAAQATGLPALSDDSGIEIDLREWITFATATDDDGLIFVDTPLETSDG